jgi:predicted nucleic acid-binding protein
MIYLDASALVTIVVERRHAEALRRYLDEQADQTGTSVIGLVETVRTCDQLGSYPNLMARLSQQHYEVTVTDSVRDAAADIPGALRALDALHVASAEQFGSELRALVTYDRRMAGVARDRGLPVAMPGME